MKNLIGLVLIPVGLVAMVVMPSKAKEIGKAILVDVKKVLFWWRV